MRLFPRKKVRAANDPEGRSPDSGVKYKDLGVMQALVERGADLGQPRSVRYYLYFPSSEKALQASELAQLRGFAISVSDPLAGYPNQWSLSCELHDVVLSTEVVRVNGDFFDELAGQFGGEYDGWETSVH